MKLPYTAPVCIIDDNKKEYEKLFVILNRLRIGYIHFNGTRAQIPKQRICGVRMVFLDMHLGDDAVHATTVAQTANIFSRTISPETSPILVVVWSKYVSEINNFRNALYAAAPEFRGKLVFYSVQKPVKIVLRELKRDIGAALSQATALKVFWGWEALAHKAAISATSEIGNIVGSRPAVQSASDYIQERDAILENLKLLINTLIHAKGAQHTNIATAPMCFLHVLAAMHVDRMEESPELALIKESSKLLLQPAPACAPEEKASINTMLILGGTSRGDVYKPGTLYEVKRLGALTKRWGIPSEAIWRELFHKNDPTADPVGYTNWKAACKMVLAEITPSCDFANKYQKSAKLISGLLIPENIIDKSKVKKPLRRDGSNYSLVYVNISGTRYLPVFTGRFVQALPLTTRLSPMIKQIGRIREPAITDLRGWAALQSSRVGFTTIADPI